MKKAPALLFLLLLLCSPAPATELKSPNGPLVVPFGLTDSGGLRYDVGYRGKPVITQSRLGLELKEFPNLMENFRVTRVDFREHDETWKPVYGERSGVRDRYREMVVDLAGTDLQTTHLRMTFRAYDQGVAFCYTIPHQPSMTEVVITREKSEFGFVADHLAWAVYSAQGNYSAVPLSKIQSGCERPLTMRMSDNMFAAVAEARLVDYARMKLGPRMEPPLGLVSELSGPVSATLPLTTPWRVIMLADSPGELLENNDMILNLNDPCAIDDSS